MEENLNQYAKYCILHISNLQTIDYENLLDTSSETVRKDESGNYFIVESNTEEIPQDVVEAINSEDDLRGYGPFSYETMIKILSGNIDSPTGTGWTYSGGENN